jgi:hypothetical protein
MPEITEQALAEMREAKKALRLLREMNPDNDDLPLVLLSWLDGEWVVIGETDRVELLGRGPTPLSAVKAAMAATEGE